MNRAWVILAAGLLVSGCEPAYDYCIEDTGQFSATGTLTLTSVAPTSPFDTFEVRFEDVFVDEVDSTTLRLRSCSRESRWLTRFDVYLGNLRSGAQPISLNEVVADEARLVGFIQRCQYGDCAGFRQIIFNEFFSGNGNVTFDPTSRTIAIEFMFQTGISEPDITRVSVTGSLAW